MVSPTVIHYHQSTDGSMATATEVLAQFPEAADGIGQFPQVLLCFDPQEVAQHLNKLLE